MKLLKTILITSAVTLPLGFYVSTLMLKPDTVQRHGQTAATVVSPVAPKNSAEPQQNTEVSLLKTEVQGLKADIIALREEMHSMVKAKAAATLLGRDADKAALRSDEDIRVEEEKHFAAQGEALELDFRQQTIVPAWSTEAMALVRKGLASDKISDSAIVSLECRARTCRLELANNGKNQAPDFVEFPQQIAGELSNMMASQTESSDSTTVFYLAKEEFVLPN